MAPPNFQVKHYAAMPVPLYAGERPLDEFDGGARLALAHLEDGLSSYSHEIFRE